jgi:hypothetical protein
MLETILLDAACLTGLIHAVAPVALRGTYRVAAQRKPHLVPWDGMPAEVQEQVEPSFSSLQNLGFQFVGCYDFGEVASHTTKLVAVFSNQENGDLAYVQVIRAAEIVESYLEFSTQFSGGFTIETNTNGYLPLTPENPATRTFRFPETHEAGALYRLHRRLVAKYAPTTWAQTEARGEEIGRITLAMANYGPRHEKLGYMKLSTDQKSFTLTWKGAALMAWRGLWPGALLRKVAYRQAMRRELASLEVRGVPALRKA